MIKYQPTFVTSDGVAHTDPDAAVRAERILAVTAILDNQPGAHLGAVASLTGLVARLMVDHHDVISAIMKADYKATLPTGGLIASKRPMSFIGEIPGGELHKAIADAAETESREPRAPYSFRKGPMSLVGERAGEAVFTKEQAARMVGKNPAFEAPYGHPLVDGHGRAIRVGDEVVSFVDHQHHKVDGFTPEGRVLLEGFGPGLSVRSTDLAVMLAARDTGAEDALAEREAQVAAQMDSIGPEDLALSPEPTKKAYDSKGTTLYVGDTVRHRSGGTLRKITVITSDGALRLADGGAIKFDPNQFIVEPTNDPETGEPEATTSPVVKDGNGFPLTVGNAVKFKRHGRDVHRIAEITPDGLLRFKHDAMSWHPSHYVFVSEAE